MGIKIKNLQTGEFEKFNIPALKGEKGEPGEIEPSEKVDYIGKQHSKLRDTMNANVDYIIKTAIGEFNYLDYEGQHITATNSIEGHARSAILRGNTLVNVNRSNFIAKSNITTDYANAISLFDTNMKASTTYTIIAYSDNLYNYRLSEMRNEREVGLGVLTVGTPFVYTTDTAFTGLRGYLKGDILNIPKGTEIKILIVEGDHSNEGIPYFEGMQSVKLPVLTTIGKNLFNISNLTHGKPYIIPTSTGYTLTTYSCSTGQRVSDVFPNLIVGEKYVLSFQTNNSSTTGAENSIGFYDLKTTNLVYYRNNQSFTLTSELYARQVILYGVHDTLVEFSNVQLEKGTQATSYEPYKSNILTVNEDVELRGIGGIQDTLDCLTGGLTQRIEKVVLDGSELWTQGGSQSEGLVRFYAPPTNKKHATGKVMSSDITPYNGITPYGVVGYENITGYSHNIHLNVNIKMDRIGVTDLTNAKQNAELFKLWLSQNPITVQYELETPIIKTVALSDNHVYSYGSTTHYSCSSEEGSLVPTLSVKVPTDTQLTIQEQKATTQTLLIKNMDLQQSIKEVQAMNLAFNTALYNSFNGIREEVEDIKKHVSTNENLEGSF